MNTKELVIRSKEEKEMAKPMGMAHGLGVCQDIIPQQSFWLIRVIKTESKLHISALLININVLKRRTSQTRSLIGMSAPLLT